MAVEKVGLYHDKRRGKPWVVRWFGESDENGQPRRYSESFKLKRDAITCQMAKQVELDAGGCRDKIDISVGELCDRFLESNKHRLRRASYQRYGMTIAQLKPFFSPDRLVRKIRRQNAETFIATRKIIHPDHKRKKTELSAGARNRHLTCARAIFQAAVDWEYIKKNPFAGIRRSKSVPRGWHFVCPAEFKQILASTDGRRLRALYSVVYGAGLRYGEAVNLLWNGQDIDFERGRINITNRPATRKIPPFMVKDYESRSLPMPQWLQDILIQHQAETAEGCPFAFVPADRWPRVKARWGKLYASGRADTWDNAMLVNNVLRNFRVTCRKVGISTDKKLTLHGLRKAYAQNLADHGTPISTLKNLMGHSDIQTTAEFYLQSSDANELQACRVLDHIMGDLKTDAKVTPEASENERSEKFENSNSRSYR